MVYYGQTFAELKTYYHTTKFWNYYLMPHWENGKCNIEEVVSVVHDAYGMGMRWELTTQMHKWAGIP